jgi:hypothetical protein
LPVDKKDKNIIGAKFRFGRFGLHRGGGSSLPTGMQASSISISKENKTNGAIADIHIKDIN